MVREGKPKVFFYLDHRTTDGRCNIITDVHITPATVHDSIPYLDRLDRQAVDFGWVHKQVEGIEPAEEIFTGAVKIRSSFTAAMELFDAQFGFLDEVFDGSELD